MGNPEVVIVGGGISGLSLAYYLRRKAPALEIKIIEADNRVGGKILTESISGFLCEGGVNGFLSNRPSTIGLSVELNLEPIKGSEKSKIRYILTDGKLTRVPDSPLKFLFSPLLSLRGKVRMLGEFFVKATADEIDESVESFVSRRVGREFHEKLIDALSTGIYAGDPTRMSMKSCFPKVYYLEKKYGGLIRGFLAAKREKRDVKTQPTGVLLSFREGMTELVRALEEVLSSSIIKGKRVLGLTKSQSGYTLSLSDGVTVETEKVILACPAYDTAEILRDLDRELSKLLLKIPYPPLSVVAMAFKEEQIGFGTSLYGFLIPFRERRKILGTLFDSSIFPNRAPEGYSLLRTMVGGRRAPELAELDDDRLLDLTLQELRELLKIRGEPHFVKIFRWQRAIPQYEVGHEENLKRIYEILSKFQGLYLTGNALRGVSVNDCIENSERLAEKIANQF